MTAKPSAAERRGGVPTQSVGTRKRLAVLSDFPEENWPSMDLCAEMLLAQANMTSDIAATRVCPPFRHAFGSLPILGKKGAARNADRFLNRHWHFSRHVRKVHDAFDCFHVCDHSYGQLIHALPGERTGVICHDIDAFRCLVEPDREPRPRWFRWMMRRVLTGMQRAAVVFHESQAVGDELLKFGLVAPEKLVFAPLGHAPEFSPQGDADPVAERILAEIAGRPFVLHVGSSIPRKRIDFLLQVFSELRHRFPALHLVKVGGTWSAEHVELIERHDLGPAITHVQRAERPTLAALYRQADLLMLPSEAEGFGLPVIEGLACGAPVLVSDIPVFREVGGNAVLYAPLLDLEAWRTLATKVLEKSATVPSLDTRLAQAHKYSWSEHARIVLGKYRELTG